MTYEDWEPQANYQTVAIPDDINHKDYDTNQRRAKLYERIKDKGFGGLASYRKLGPEFGVSAAQIGKDIKELRRYILKHDFDSEKFRSKIIDDLNWALEKAREEEDYDTASKISKRLNNYLQSIGIEQEEPDKVKVEEEVSHSFRKAFQEHHGDNEEEEE